MGEETIERVLVIPRAPLVKMTFIVLVTVDATASIVFRAPCRLRLALFDVDVVVESASGIQSASLLHHSGATTRQPGCSPEAVATRHAAKSTPRARRSPNGFCLGNASQAGCISPTCLTAPRTASGTTRMNSGLREKRAAAAAVATSAWSVDSRCTPRRAPCAAANQAKNPMGMKFAGNARCLGARATSGAAALATVPHMTQHEFEGPLWSLGRAAEAAQESGHNSASMRGTLI